VTTLERPNIDSGMKYTIRWLLLAGGRLIRGSNIGILVRRRTPGQLKQATAG